MHSLKYKVTTSTCDSNGRLKLFSALQMMQDCSEMWIDSEPTVKHYFAQQNMTQLLATRQVEVVRLPEFKGNTFIYDAQGEPCFKTWSMGAFVDLATGKLKRIDDATIASIAIDPQQEMHYRDRRIIVPKEGAVAHPPVPVMRADIDYNKHMNNANYVRIAMELLPSDFVVNGMRMEYRVPAKLGDELTPTVYDNGDTIIVSLLTGSETSAIIEFSR